jgi:hypothetical protein
VSPVIYWPFLFLNEMTPSRPYKCLKDIVTDAGQMYTVEVTVNLFEVDNYCEVNNELEGIKDDIKRTIVYLPEGRAFILRVSYKEFDAMIMQLKEDYQLLDTRSILQPDKIRYKGYIKISGACKKSFMVATFHRKDYELQGNTENDFQEFAYHALFNYIYPMN